MNDRAKDPVVGCWILDRAETAAWIEKRALRSSVSGVLQGSEQRARQQRAMLEATDVTFHFRADGTFDWETVMQLPQGRRSAWTRGRWSHEPGAVRIELVEQEGQRLTPPPSKSGRLSGDTLVFEDPLMDLVIRKRPEPSDMV